MKFAGEQVGIHGRSGVGQVAAKTSTVFNHVDNQAQTSHGVKLQPYWSIQISVCLIGGADTCIGSLGGFFGSADKRGV